MKAINFTFNGGFPLTQDELDYLQGAYTECIGALASVGVNGNIPSILSGMVVTAGTGGAVTVTVGWFLYNGELVQFTGGTVTPAGSDAALVLISNNTTSLTFNDGTSNPAIVNRTASLITGVYIITGTRFPVSYAVPFQTQFGLNGRESTWSTIFVNTLSSVGNVTGNIYYKKNFITNTLHIRGSLTANSALNFAASPTSLNYLMGTLPAGYVPASNAYFTAYYYGANLFKDDLGIAWVKQLTSYVSTTGQVQINFLKPESSISAYSVVFNSTIPLD